MLGRSNKVISIVTRLNFYGKETGDVVNTYAGNKKIFMISIF